MKSGFLANLRNQGYDVKIRHIRKFAFMESMNAPSVCQMTRGEWKNKYPQLATRLYILGKGGSTEVTAISPTGEVFNGQASCHPTDNYNRSAGIELALKQAFNSKKKNDSVCDTDFTFQVLVAT